MKAGLATRPINVALDIPIGGKIVRGRPVARHASRFRRTRLFRGSTRLLRPPGALSRERRGLQGQLRAVHLLLPRRDGSDPAAGAAGRRAALQRLADGPDPGAVADRVQPRPGLRRHRFAVDDPQHGVPGHLLALGHAPDRAGLEVLQLAADGVLRKPEPAEDGHRVCRRDYDGQSAVCRRDPGSTRTVVDWKACCNSGVWICTESSTESITTFGIRPKTINCRGATTRAPGARGSGPANGRCARKWVCRSKRTGR